jgi:Domain of unknown function (DUF4352)
VTPKLLAVAAVALSAAMSLSACGTPIITTVTNGSGGKAGPAKTAAVGDMIQLTGVGKGERVDVTVVKVVDPAKGANFSTPTAGNRYVSVQFTLRNTGTAAYSDSPSDGVQVVDTEGQAFNATLADTSAGPAFPASTSIAPGETGKGYITFEVPKASKVSKVQFALNSGFANQKGQWGVASAATP